MEIRVKAYDIEIPDKIIELNAKVNENNYEWVKSKLIYEDRKIVNYLKELKNQGIINIITSKPKVNDILTPGHKELQEKIDKLIKVKRELKKSIKAVDEIFR